MNRNTTIIDSSGKWASAEEILTSPRNRILSRPTSSFLSDWGIEAVAGKQAENSSARMRREDPRLSYHPSASSASALSYLTSQHGLSPLSPTRPEGRIPLVPVRRSVQPEQMPRPVESEDSIIHHSRSLTHKRSSSAPALDRGLDRIEFPNPQLASPYTHASQDAYKPTSTSAPRVELQPGQTRSAPQIPMPRPFPMPSSQRARQEPLKHIADNLDSHLHPPDPAAHPAQATHPNSFVTVNPFHPQIRNKYEKDPSSFDDIPVQVERQPPPQSSIRPYLGAGEVSTESPGQPASNGRGYPGKNVDNTKEGPVEEGQAQDRQTRLVPIRRNSDVGHQPHEGSLENYAAYPWKPPLPPSSHSLSRPNSYGMNPGAALEKPTESLWGIFVGYLAWPPTFRARRSRGTYSFSSPYTHPSSDSSDSSNRARGPGALRSISNFTLKFLPAQVYLLLLLRVPSFYFSRVARIFEEADMTLPEIKKMALTMMALERGSVYEDDKLREGGVRDGGKMEVGVPPVYRRLRVAWEGFVDDVVSEWKMLNIISVLLAFVILSTIQIENTSATADPVVRYTALFALLCAIMSLAFGCVYVLRFGTMRKIWKAAEWALEAKRTKVFVWWNGWVMLAMPVIWLSWSIILYLTCLMTFIWRTSSQAPSNLSTHAITDTALLVVRVVLSVLLGSGILYMSLAMRTLGKFGDGMDRSWRRRAAIWVKEREEEEEERGRGVDGVWRSGTWRPSQVGPAPRLTAYVGEEGRKDVREGEGFFVKAAATAVPSAVNYVALVPDYDYSRLSADKSNHGHQREKGTPNGGVDFNSATGVSQGLPLTVTQGHANAKVNATPTTLITNVSKGVNKTSEVGLTSPSQDGEPEDAGFGSANGNGNANANTSASARRKTKTTSLAMPPPASLPPIPGTPMSGSGLSGPRSRSVRTNATLTTTATASSSAAAAAAERSVRHYSGFSLDSAAAAKEVRAGAGGDGEEGQGQRRVLSPMASFSAMGSEYLGSGSERGTEADGDGDGLSNVESEVVSEVVSEGSRSWSVPWTPLPSPASPASGSVR